MSTKVSEIIPPCPYTGLRSFTEEESLYFKGRDLQVDQISALLERNKFLMVTGASGDGKTSLIYAGLVPNARAGFFKSDYTNWIVADFRPERNPLVNMARALARTFNKSTSTIETELRRGFSSLIDLYTNSEFYQDRESESWTLLSENEKKEKKRQCANLLILVDQFEEFFTNPENFHNESPTQDSQVVVNLVLETARIAIKRNLPVYIVCTMRSDYIGQCSAFRGLPEYIGFSQFFVPRLKRKDLKQVIEEPAILSGNRISQRLIERIVFDIAEGVDQLPILQHVMARIWLTADHGREEMDLVHYAMVGGMPANELPDEDQRRFAAWFDMLPEYQKKLYGDTGLEKVIEIHANLLYEQAWSTYHSNYHGSITQQDAKRIIALTFSCLTRIDNSRAVRNRMTLGEITAVIHAPHLSVEVVGQVLNIFREEGNSYLRPFITDDPSTRTLSPESVLDITHESLIRNWNKLNQWANQEFDFYTTYLDFKKQLDRWKESGKNSGYLLPIGPLTYFENWFARCKPNAAWIQRYLDNSTDQAAAKRYAEEILADTREFIRRSARKVAVSRAFMKYGPRRIATGVAMVIMLVLSGFYWYDAEQKVNERVIAQVRKDAMTLMQSSEVNLQAKATYLIVEERYSPGAMMKYLSTLDYSRRVPLSIEASKLFHAYDKDHEGPIKSALLTSIVNDLNNPPSDISHAFVVQQSVIFFALLSRDNYYNPTPAKEQLITKLTASIRDLVLKIFRDPKQYSQGLTPDLNMALQYWLTTGKATPDQINEIIRTISPLSGDSAVQRFNVYYAKGVFEPNGRQPMDYSGGHHMLACLYATAGDFKGIEWCFNQLIETGQRDYFELVRQFNSHLNILGYLYQYHHDELVPSYMKWVSTRTSDNPPATLFVNAVNRSGYISPLFIGNIRKEVFRSFRGFLHPNLNFMDRTAFHALMRDYEKELNQIANPDERNFQLAMFYKRKAMFEHKYLFDRKLPVDEAVLTKWLDLALEHYAKVSQAYRHTTVSSTTIYYLDGVRNSKVRRDQLFIYPDYRGGWFAVTFHSDLFYRHLRKTGWMEKLYQTGEDLQTLHYWLAKAYEYRPTVAPGTADNLYPLPTETLEDILSFVEHHPAGGAFDKTLLALVLGNRAFDKGDTTAGMKYFNMVDKSNLAKAYDRYEYLEKTFFLNKVKELAVNLVVAGKYREGVLLTEAFTFDDQKMYSYIAMAKGAYKNKYDPQTFVFLDSAFSKAKDLDFNSLSNIAVDPWVDPRHHAVKLLSQIGSEPLNTIAVEMMRNVLEDIKPITLVGRVGGVTSEGNYYRALTSIPPTLTEEEDLDCRATILLEACRRSEAGKSTEWSGMDRFIDWRWNYIFFFPI